VNISFFDRDTVVWSDDMNDNKKVEQFVGTTREIRFLIPTDWGEGEEPNEFFNNYSATMTITKEEKNRKRRTKRRGAYQKERPPTMAENDPTIRRERELIFLRFYDDRRCYFYDEKGARTRDEPIEEHKTSYAPMPYEYLWYEECKNHEEQKNAMG